MFDRRTGPAGPCIRALGALGAIALLGLPAQAQARIDLAGAWAFETAPETSDNCVISGRAQLAPTRRADRFNVRMQVMQRCDIGADIHTEQDCVATRTEQDVLIDCRLITAPETPYLPDNFTLRLRSPSLMEGNLVSGWIAPAVWRRDGDAYVS